ncbi:MAG: hypothetical protein VR65_03715 [Desulfobulbaceae bacterium BRH_c16a]|nr:MAG: hypothetical protein VR65_03715 [Desulfobulbaceae bacterium BRH_c16a]
MNKLPLSTNENQLWDNRIDIIKGICALGIVGVHFAGSFIGRPGIRWEPAFFVGLYWNQIFTFAVPVFIFISGFLIGRKNYPSTPVFYLHRINSLIPQYFLVCIAWWVLFPHAGFIQDLTWDNIFIRLFYRGIQGTQYFVSAILQLVLLAPLIRLFVEYISERFHRNSVFLLAVLLLLLHLALGNACFKGVLNYYYYCLPFSPFWLFFFFFGLYTERLLVPIYKRIGFIAPFLLLFLGALGAQTYNLYRCSTPEIAGLEINTIPFDYAYSRPSMLVYDLCIVGCLAFVLVCRSKTTPLWLQGFRFFGKYSYEIYLWHLVLLQYIGWGSPANMQLCEKHPIAIIALCIISCVIISITRNTYDILLSIFVNNIFLFFQSIKRKAIFTKDH